MRISVGPLCLCDGLVTNNYSQVRNAERFLFFGSYKPGQFSLRNYPLPIPSHHGFAKSFALPAMAMALSALYLPLKTLTAIAEYYHANFSVIGRISTLQEKAEELKAENAALRDDLLPNVPPDSKIDRESVDDARVEIAL